MILTVTPNAAVDKTYRVEGFQLDRVHRPSRSLTAAGGKGVNVARVYRTLGGAAVATGYLGGLNGRIVSRALSVEGIEDAFVRVRGESRLCIAVVDPTTGTQTEVNENGPRITIRAVAALKRRVEEQLATGRFLVLTLNGSLPPGAPDDLYADLIAIAERAGVRTVLDASGAPLRAGLTACPWMAKPNRFELESVLGRPVSTLGEAYAAAIELRERGVRIAIATLGRVGAIMVADAGAWTAAPPEIEFASAVASGDAFLAAFIRSLLVIAPDDLAAALALATGAGAANAAEIGAGFCSYESIRAQAARSRVERIA